MRLVEQTIIKPNHKYYKTLKDLCSLSKALYNKSTYILSNYLAQNGKLPGKAFYNLIKNEPEYKALPLKVSGQLVNQIQRNWFAFFSACKSYSHNPGSFQAQPKPPNHYKKPNQLFMLIYPNDAIYSKDLKLGYIHLTKSDIKFPTKQTKINQVRIIPHKYYLTMEVIYERTVVPNPNLNPNFYAAIDLGVNNLTALTFSEPGLQPLLINGRPLKSINHYYNRKKAHYESKLGKYNNGKPRKASKRLSKLELKRNCKINNYLHKASRKIIDMLVNNNIGTLIIGYNQDWKQSVNIGSRNNQNFCYIPFYKFVNMLKYKAELIGIKIIQQEESYTSKCSFLDLEPIQHHTTYLGKRIKRGLFKSACGLKINADVNGSYNILRKAIPRAFSTGIQGIVVCPVGLPINF